MNDFQTVMNAAWQLMSIQFTLYGFTISYSQVFLFTVLSSIVAYAIFKILWG